MVAINKTGVRDGSRPMSVTRGDVIYIDFVTAGVRPCNFPDEIKLDCPDELNIHHGRVHACLGRPFVAAPLYNFRRAPGPAGEMKSKAVRNAFKVSLAEDGGQWEPCLLVGKHVRAHREAFYGVHWHSHSRHALALVRSWKPWPRGVDPVLPNFDVDEEIK